MSRSWAKISLSLIFLSSGGPALASAEPDLQALIDAAPAGSSLRVPAGTYRGHFIIKKPLTVTAARDAVLDGEGKGTVLSVSSENVALDGLVIQNSGNIIGNSDSSIMAENSPHLVVKNCILRHALFGIQLLGSPDAIIEGNEISSFKDYPIARRGDLLKIWYSPRAQILHNRVSDGRDVLVWYSDHSLLDGNRIERMRYALHYMYSHENTASNNSLRESSVGIYDMYGNGLKLENNSIISNRGPSGYGVALKEADRARLSGNRLVGNRIGLQLDNSPLSPPAKPEDLTLFEDNRFARNDIGVAFVGSGYGSVFLKNDFIDNWQQVSTGGLQAGTVVWTNNYWSDYRGIDPRGTGVGVIPYSADSVTDDITDRFESFKLFNFGPAMLALDFAQKMIPWIQSAPKAVDYAPATRPHREDASKHAPLAQRLGLLALSATLLAVVAVLRRKLVI